MARSCSPSAPFPTVAKTFSFTPLPPSLPRDGKRAGRVKRGVLLEDCVAGDRARAGKDMEGDEEMWRTCDIWGDGWAMGRRNLAVKSLFWMILLVFPSEGKQEK